MGHKTADRRESTQAIPFLSYKELKDTIQDGDGCSTTSSDPFELPKQQRQCIQRREWRNNIVKGKAQHVRVKGAGDLSRNLFIYRVNPNTQTDDLKAFISVNGFSVVTLTLLLSTSHISLKCLLISLKTCLMKSYDLLGYMSESFLTQGDTNQLIKPVTNKMINVDNNLVVATYNTQGHGLGRIDYISELLSKTHLLLWQEHWFLKKELDQVANKFGDMNVSCHGTFVMDESVILEGRPYGGCLIMWKSAINAVIRPLVCISKRIFGIKMCLKVVNF